MGETILFCIVFLSQVLLISWFYPRRIVSRGRYVLHHFPQSTHPKLYPYPPEQFERWLRKIERFNFAIVVAGVSIIAGLILATLGGEWDGKIVTPWSASGRWVAAIVIPFFIVQFIVALAYMNFSGRKLLLAMAKAPPPRVRTTELRRRRLVDFVSPTMLVVAALTNVAFIIYILCDYWFFGLSRFKAVGSILSALLVLLVFSVTVALALRAPKSDPYQAQKDRGNLIKLVVQQALAFSIAYPVLLAIWLTIKIFDPHLLEPVIASLFCQGIALASLLPSYRYRLDQVDFNVYRQGA
ncbi:hypothetical protein ACFPN2_21400 [Steroidobacter flavus]|uniref:Uncharacterized protein n=1 Tax=Steroidobacter flavus TaxID=1842136 RepID=A0ABV8SXI5_9GAMM